MEEGQSEAVTNKAVEKNTAEANGEKSLKNVKNRQDKLKFSYKEQKEYETIDADIAALEEKIEKLEQNLPANART